MTIDERIRDSGLKIGHICKVAGVHEATFWRWRNGKAKPDNLAALQKVADILGCHITDICPEMRGAKE